MILCCVILALLTAIIEMMPIVYDVRQRLLLYQQPAASVTVALPTSLCGWAGEATTVQVQSAVWRLVIE